MDAAHKHTLKLAKNAADGLRKIPGIKIYGDHSKDDVSGVVSFLHESLHAEDIARMLDSMGIAVRTGHHCAQPLLDRLEITGTLRVSLYFYNTHEEVESFIEYFSEILERFA